MATLTYVWQTIRVSIQKPHPPLSQDPACLPMVSSPPSSALQASTEARKLVLSAIVTTLDKQEFLATTTRAAAVQILGKCMLKLPENNLAFNNFCDYLVGTLKKNFQTVGRCWSSATKREHLWRAFHRQSIEELPSKWNGLYTALCLTYKVDNLFHQTVNLVIYEQLLKEHFAVERAPQSTVEVQLSKDELNALRYASGYVSRKLLKKYEKKGEKERKKMGKKIEQFEMCLGNMAVAGEETEFTQCSSEWFHMVNRGGLFPINDETLTFFIAVEKVTQQHLPRQQPSQGQENMKKSVMKAISEDLDVQFYWTLISRILTMKRMQLSYSQTYVICGSLYVVFLWLQLGWRNIRN